MTVSLLLFAATEAFFSASPGPAVVMVVSAMLVGGWRAAHAIIFGVLLGNLIYFAVSCALVLGAAQYNEQFFLYLKLAGATYLVYLVAARYCGSPKRAGDAGNAPARPLRRNLRKLFLGGLAMQLANPKTILFFGAFLPQFVHADHNIPVQFAIMAGLSWSIEYPILALYAGGARYLLRRFNNQAGKLEHLGNFTMMTAVAWSLYTAFS
ncbi:MAG: LysE family translocator [Gammaproteobacteria bacterium]|nr:LysE family translocator [Gammaproteobacteria bacterium]MDD9875590.1 LysE family translocator [Gammaproteobacteria bacterium]